MKKSTLKGIIIAVVVLALIGAGVALSLFLEKRSQVAPDGAGTSSITTTVQGTDEVDEAPDYEAADERPTVTIDGKEYYFNENISTLLMMGVDDMEIEEYNSYRNQALADFLVLAIFDRENKVCTLLQINRNTMSDVPVLNVAGDFIGVTEEQICYAHTYGNGLEKSCENTVDAVSRLLYSIPIDNYLSLTMASITAINDTVGGVTVKVEDDFSGVDDTLVQGQTVTLLGEHAVNFVRSRMNMKDDGTNEARMRRQSVYMAALVDKLKEKVNEDSSFILELYAAVADYLVTDCDIDQLSQLSQDLVSYDLGNIVTPEGNITHGKYAEFHPDEKKLQQLVTDLFYIPAE